VALTTFQAPSSWWNMAVIRRGISEPPARRKVGRSAAHPIVPSLYAAHRADAGGEKIKQHPALALLNRPNRFMGRSRFWGTIMMHLDIGGNAYIEKVRSASRWRQKFLHCYSKFQVP
jgi:Phage portal protein